MFYVTFEAISVQILVHGVHSNASEHTMKSLLLCCLCETPDTHGQQRTEAALP